MSIHILYTPTTWQGFLHLHWAKWKRVLLTRSISIIPTVVVASVTSSRLEDMTQWLNVLQSVQLPFALIPIMHFTSSPRVMGEFHNTLWVGILREIGKSVALVFFLICMCVHVCVCASICVCVGVRESIWECICACNIFRSEEKNHAFIYDLDHY